MSQRTTQRPANQAISLPISFRFLHQTKKAYVAPVLGLVRHRRSESHFNCVLRQHSTQFSPQHYRDSLTPLHNWQTPLRLATNVPLRGESSKRSREHHSARKHRHPNQRAAVPQKDHSKSHRGVVPQHQWVNNLICNCHPGNPRYHHMGTSHSIADTQWGDS